MLSPFCAPAFYQLAGQNIFFNPGVPELRKLRIDGKSSTHHELPGDLSTLMHAAPAIRVSGELAGRSSTISVWQDECGVLLNIPAAGHFWIAADGAAIIQVTMSPGVDRVFHSQSLLGPPLVLALALQGTWCLHASAVLYENKVIAFLGVSGTGKSTLAEYLMGQSGVCRLSDDILPIQWKNGALIALPHFPQLKLSADQQPGLELPARFPLAAIYLLDEQPQISIQVLSQGATALNLVRQTLAARLFSRYLLGEHFDFCGQIATGIPMCTLAYPRKLSSLPAVWQAIQEDLAGQLA